MSAVKMRRSETPCIDVLIPAVEKDLKTLPRVIDAIRQQVKHPIGQILVVSPRSERIQRLCEQKRCRFVDENTVLPITKKHINYRSRKWEKSGWLFQQLLKWSGDKLCAADHFLVVDADTVLIRPHVFKVGGKTVFYCRRWTQPEYYRMYRRLLGKPPSSRLSFVTHYMLFNKKKLAQLKRTIESRHHTSWYEAILNNIDRTKPFAFSEFETYGNFVYGMNPDGVIRKPALNKSLRTPIGKLTPQKIRSYARRYRSLSFHQRKVYARKPAAARLPFISRRPRAQR